MFKLWSAAKATATFVDPLVDMNELLKLDVALIGWMS